MTNDRKILAVSAVLLALLLGSWAARAGSPASPPVGTPPSAPVLLRTHALVDDRVVRLEDLFDGLDNRDPKLGRTAVARAPEPGRRIEVDARWLAAVARAYALPWRPNSRYDRATIERASQVIEIGRIESATIDALVARGASGRISVVFDNPALRLHLPTGAPASLAIAGLSYDPASGRFKGQVVAPAEGSPAARATITGRAFEMTDIPVLGRRVEPGEVIARKDIEWVPTRANRLSRNTVTSEDRLLGKSPRRPIRAGQAVLSTDLREPILVEKNSIVTIRLVNPRLILTVQGRALDQGAAGEVIRVMNTKSKTIIDAAVAQTGLVRVFAATLAGIDLEDRK